jgi:hypothetical protein
LSAYTWLAKTEPAQVPLHEHEQVGDAHIETVEHVSDVDVQVPSPQLIVAEYPEHGPGESEKDADTLTSFASSVVWLAIGAIVVVSITRASSGSQMNDQAGPRVKRRSPERAWRQMRLTSVAAATASERTRVRRLM